MTLAITIAHAAKGYNMRAKITETNPVDGSKIAEHIVADGESKTLYVHSHRALTVEEIGPADRETQTITAAEVGDAAQFASLA